MHTDVATQEEDQSTKGLSTNVASMTNSTDLPVHRILVSSLHQIKLPHKRKTNQCGLDDEFHGSACTPDTRFLPTPNQVAAQEKDQPTQGLSTALCTTLASGSFCHLDDEHVGHAVLLDLASNFNRAAHLHGIMLIQEHDIPADTDLQVLALQTQNI